MTGDTLENVTKTFKFSYPTCSQESLRFNLEVPVKIPHNGSTEELVQRVLRMFHIPVYLEDELNEELEKFVDEETKKFHNERDDNLITLLKNNDLNVEAIVKDWDKNFKDNVVEFADQIGTSDEEVFAGAYHKLVHSPALETILQVENSYAKTMIETLKNRDEDISKLTQRQTEEMEEKMRLLNTFTTEADINELASVHFEEQSLTQGRWASELDALGKTQRNELRTWLMTTLEEYQSTSGLNTPSSSPVGAVSAAPLPPPPQPRAVDESFTIHLGSQLKHTHNIRLLSIDLLDLCSTDHVYNESEASRRLQTALGLYSHELSAVVLVSEGPRSPLMQAFTRSASSTTEYHFQGVEDQLSDIMETLGARDAAGERARLAPGDVLITKHSNLSDSHVVFHLIADHSLGTNDITSRHPVILGLRNILRVCRNNDVASVALPMLLTNDVAEGRTLAWCLRRAELVLKCVKGFMTEGYNVCGCMLRTLTLSLSAALAAGTALALQQAPAAVFSQPQPLRL